ncbi:MAG TPA: TlpA disulfide reductase family protein [Terriglobia bacterium]|nr:TlpA disulfide reductase family protein [Terriglobia bacterium]
MRPNRFALLAVLCLLVACNRPAPQPENTAATVDPETRIVRYLEERAKAGEPIVVSTLYNDVFKEPEERQVLDRLFNSFSRIPLSIVEFQNSTGRIPTLVELSEQFGFKIDGEMNVVLKIMESDPRVPHFLERDSRTGEIVRIDTSAIRGAPPYGQIMERGIAGWVGRRAPRFSMQSFSGGTLSTADVAGSPYLIYFWFTHCPPCMKTAPLLAALETQYASRGFKIVGANADRILDLPYTDADRAAYVKEHGINFPVGHLTNQMQQAFGSVTLYPTFFFVNRDGVIVKHLSNLQDKATLEAAIQAAIGSSARTSERTP